MENFSIKEKAEKTNHDFRNNDVLARLLNKCNGDIEGLKNLKLDEIFALMKQNGKIKKRIIDLIKALKNIRKKMKESK